MYVGIFQRLPGRTQNLCGLESNSIGFGAARVFYNGTSRTAVRHRMKSGSSIGNVHTHTTAKRTPTHTRTHEHNQHCTHTIVH